jgi:AcrR family transcriptional regulator
LAEQGYGELTVKHIIVAAGVSRTTFYANFDNKRDCVLAAHRDVFERLVASILRACAAERQWPAKISAAIGAVFSFALEAPEEARLLTLVAVATDLTIVRQVFDSNAHLAALLRDGRRQAPPGPSLPDLTEKALVGAVSSILGRRLHDRGGIEDLPELESEIVQFVLTPYLGIDEAARVAGGS